MPALMRTAITTPGVWSLFGSPWQGSTTHSTGHIWIASDAQFERLLKESPANARVPYEYGVFLAGSARPQQALLHLQKALASGVPETAYSLGMIYLKAPSGP